MCKSTSYLGEWGDSPHSEASTGSGSGRQQPSASALPTAGGWLPTSSRAAAESAHTAVTVSGRELHGDVACGEVAVFHEAV